MSNFLTLLSLVSVLSPTPATSFQTVLNHASTEDVLIASENNIVDWNDYETYMTSDSDVPTPNLKSKGNNGSSVSEGITDIASHLSTNYPDYTWIRDTDNCALTSEVSGFIPIEMQTENVFSDTDITTAINSANVGDITDYGGCGPIAALGILDYFARYLGYNEIIANPTDSQQRIDLATEFLSDVHFSVISNFGDFTLVWPWDTASTFNKIISNHGLGGVISSNDQWSLFAGNHSSYWNDIVENVDKGLPVTMFTGLDSGDGAFARHYTNIYGYDNWVGIPNNEGERVTKRFVKARLNWGKHTEYYCDADILNCGQVGIITYNVNYSNSYAFQDDDFAEEFVNDNGNGEYYFYNVDEPVTLSNGKVLQTSRLRTSYIENKYLVLSPNRKNAGNAYLDITFPNRVSKMSITASMWGSLEGALGETFRVDYYDNGWKNHISFDLSKLSTLKDYPDDFTVLFPKDTTRVRFYANHSSPTGDRNKGRICLDNFKVEYN